MCGVVLLMRGRGRSSGSFYFGILSRSQYLRVSYRIFPAIGSVSRTRYPVYGPHVVHLIISISNGENNLRIESM